MSDTGWRQKRLVTGPDGTTRVVRDAVAPDDDDENGTVHADAGAVIVVDPLGLFAAPHPARPRRPRKKP